MFGHFLSVEQGTDDDIPLSRRLIPISISKISYKISILDLLQYERMNRIKEVLEEKALTQMWLAQKMGKSYNMINSYAQNRQQPRLEVLGEIAHVLDVDIKELLNSTK